MDKEQKAAAVEDIATRLGETGTVFAIDYRGMSVPQAAVLRERLGEAETSFRVVKNRLAKRAAEQAGAEGLGELLEGPTALAFVSGDPVVAAKAISSFSREHEVLVYKGGFLEGSPLDPDQFKTIARLPALEVLRGQLVGIAGSPLTGLVRGLNAMLSGLAVGLGQLQEKGLLRTAEAPAEEAPSAAKAEKTEEAPAEEEQPAAPEEPAQGEGAPAEEASEAPADEGEQPLAEGDETAEDQDAKEE